MRPISPLLLVSLWLSGCRLPDYAPPTSGPVATVTFDSVNLSGVRSSNEDFLNFAITVDCLGGKVGYVEVPPMSSAEVKVAAQQPLFASLSTEARGRQGTLYFSFVPRSGEQYVVIYKQLRGPRGVDSMTIEVTDASGTPVPHVMGNADWPRCGK